MELAREFKVPVLFHKGHGNGCYIHKTIIMDIKHPNLYLETSGMPMDVKIKEVIEQLGQGRVIYGSDAPFHHHSMGMQKAKGSGLDENGLRDIFYSNAVKLLGIE